MQKLIYISVILASQCFALTPDQTLLQNTQNEAQLIKALCIDVPPSSSGQAAWCGHQYNVTYYQDLIALQSGLIPAINTGTDGYVSPYSKSPYDICRYETGRLINETLCNP